MKWLVVVATLAALPAAYANGRFPGTSTITFRRGSTQDIAAGVTYGLALSHDGGATWEWMCERAVGYGGVYDPQYLYRASGKLLATTFGGLRDNRDGCTFETTQLDATYAPQIAQLADGTILAAASNATDSQLYRSTDDGATYQVLSSPGAAGDNWDSLVTSATGAHVYLTGRHLDGTTTLLVLRSTNGGASFAPLPLTGLMTSGSSQVQVVGLSPTDPDVVYVKVTLEYGNSGEGVYRMNTATETSWTRIYDALDPFAFLVRGSGELVVGAQMSAAHSTDGGGSWQPLAGAPHIYCLTESAGRVWACTQNYSSMTVSGDGFGIMTSTDLATWTGMLRYEDLVRPVACNAGTSQKDECEDGMWCPLRLQLNISSTAVTCATAGDTTAPPKPGGCCDASGEGPGIGFVIVAGLALRRRRASRDRR